MSHAESRPAGGATEQQGKLIALLLTIGMHVLLALLLVYGINWQTEHEVAVAVELVRAVPAPAPTQAPPPPPSTSPPEPEPTPEPRPLAKPDIALKDDKPKQTKPPAKEPAKNPPTARPAPDADYRNQLEQELKLASAQRKAAELQKAAEQELAGLESARAASARSQATANYIGRIRARIRSNIILPPDLRGNPEAVFDVVQFPSGEILSVQLRQSSGHAGYDAAVERAIRKSSPLPRPERNDVFERELRLTFHPLDD